MVGFQPTDARGFFMLPQAPEEAGYYVYGTPLGGLGQYANPNMLTLLMAVEREWALIDRRKFGVGNISLADGPRFPPHSGHRRGLEVDVRPLRKDGAHSGVSYMSPDYDHAATRVLIELFRACAVYPLIVYFNDLSIPGVRPLKKHDDHIHVEF